MRKSRHVTPEEKLLHIIEKPNGNTKLAAKKKVRVRLSLNFVSRLKNIDFRRLSLRSVNKALVWVSVIATLVLVFYFVKEEKTLQERGKFASTIVEKKDFAYLVDIKEELPALSSYMAYIEENNPFHVLPMIKKPVKVKEPPFALTLVGIFWSDRPQAVIEDGNTQKNYFVYTGDIVGKYTVSKITQNEVQLVSEDGDKTLR